MSTQEEKIWRLVLNKMEEETIRPGEKSISQFIQDNNLKVSRNTARRMLDEMVERGILQVRMVKRVKYYSPANSAQDNAAAASGHLDNSGQ